MSWTSPTSCTDPDAAYINEGNTYDGNLGTYAYINISGSWPNPSEYGPYLEFNIASINCSGFKYAVYSTGNFTALIDIDLYYDGSWHNAVAWDTPVHQNWKEVRFPTVYGVTKARLRFYNTGTAALSCYIYEVQFYEIGDATVSTQPATNITSNAARINGIVTDDTGETCEARFRHIPSETVEAVASAEITSFAYCHGFIYYNSYLYGVSRTNPGQVAKISIADLSSFSLITPQHGGTDATHLMDIVQSGGYLWTIDASGWLYKIDPVSFTVSSSTQILTTISISDGALCTDDTYIYATGTGYVAKFKISDSSHGNNLVAASKYFHSIGQYGSYLWVVDISDNVLRQIAKADLSLVATSGNIGSCTDDMAIGSIYIYLGQEGGGELVRVRQSDLLITWIGCGCRIGSISYGVYIISDGVQDRIVHLDYTNDVVWILEIESGEFIRRNVLDMPNFNEIVSDGTYVYLTKWTTPSITISKYLMSQIFDDTVWLESAWQNTLETDDTYYEDLAGLTPNVSYDFQTQIENSNGESAWTVSVSFDTLSSGWTGKIAGVSSPASVGGVLAANIASVKGVA